jgi:hypothetical protein
VLRKPPRRLEPQRESPRREPRLARELVLVPRESVQPRDQPPRRPSLQLVTIQALKLTPPPSRHLLPRDPPRRPVVLRDQLQPRRPLERERLLLAEDENVHVLNLYLSFVRIIVL